MLTTKTETVRGIIDDLHAASLKMTKTNPHRLVVLRAMSALIQLTRRLEGEPQPDDQKPVILTLQ